VEMSKLAEDSGSRRSIFMVRQFISGAIVLGEDKYSELWAGVRRVTLSSGD